MDSNFILEMPKLSGLDQKQLFTTEPYPKGFGIPKMKLDFQNIGNSECFHRRPFSKSQFPTTNMTCFESNSYCRHLEIFK